MIISTTVKNLSDIKLRLISLAFFFIPLFMIFVQNSIGFLLKEVLISVENSNEAVFILQYYLSFRGGTVLKDFYIN